MPSVDIAPLSMLLLALSLALIPQPSLAERRTADLHAPAENSEAILAPRHSMPAFVTRGAEFSILVKAGPDLTLWSAFLLSPVDRLALEVISSVLDGFRQVWTIRVRPGTTVPNGLYTLGIEARDSKGTQAFFQARAVRILDEFPKRFRIIHASDLHIPLDTLRARELISEVNFFDPLFVAFSGDLVDLGGTEERYREAMRMLDGLQVPVFYAPGNHDVTSGEEIYERFIGPLNYSTNIGPIHLLVLDSDEGEISTAQLAWADADLRSNAQAPIKLMMFHHSPFTRTGRGYLKNVQALVNLTTKHGVTAVLTGHAHRDHVARIGKTLFLSTTTASGELFAGGQHGFRVIRFSDSRIESYNYANTLDGSPTNSVPLGLLRAEYAPGNDGSLTAVTGKISNLLEERYVEGTLRFLLRRAVDGREQRLFVQGQGMVDIRRAQAAGNDLMLFISYWINVTAGADLSVTLALSEDNQAPTITNVRATMSPSGTVAVSADVSDQGWGIERVLVQYSVDSGQIWVFRHMTWQGGDRYASSLSALREGALLFLVVAIDLAGNIAKSITRSIEIKTEPESAVEGSSALTIVFVVLIAVLVVLAGFLALKLRRDYYGNRST